MLHKKIITLLLLIGFSLPIVWGQSSLTKEMPKQEGINILDAQKRKVGMWVNTIPARMGDDSYTEFGHYEADKKKGTWYRLNNEYQLVAIENYKNGVLDGAVQYFSNGRLVCTGNYRGYFSNKAFDTFQVEHPLTAELIQVVRKAEQGSMKDGVWRYYSEQSGKLLSEDLYQVDYLLTHKEFEQEYSNRIDSKNTTNIKLPHDGGKTKHWQEKSAGPKKSLIK